MLPLKCKIELPGAGDPGSFGAIRRFDVHTGVDLYCDDGEPVYAMEDGIIVNYGPFTGMGAGSEWWEDTDYICLKGKSGKILYGEITLHKGVLSKTNIKKGELIGWVKRVLRKDKGLPMTMLHIELYDDMYAGTGEVWELEQPKPKHLMDVTELLAREIQRAKKARIRNYAILLTAVPVALFTLNYFFEWI